MPTASYLPLQLWWIRTKLLELDCLPFFDRNWLRSNAILTLLELTGWDMFVWHASGWVRVRGVCRHLPGLVRAGG